MTEKRYYVNSAGYLCDMDLSNTLSIFECADKLNELSDENEQLKQRNSNQAKRLSELWGLIFDRDWETLEAKAKEIERNEELLKKEWGRYE